MTWPAHIEPHGVRTSPREAGRGRPRRGRERGAALRSGRTAPLPDPLPARAGRGQTVAVVALIGLSLLAGCTVDTRIATVTVDGGDGEAGGVRFALVHAGNPLPDDETCARLVRRAAWEPRPGNTTANHHLVTAAELAKVDPFDPPRGYTTDAQQLRARVTGAFEGTTDELLQWTACKWGFDEDYVRAEAVDGAIVMSRRGGDFEIVSGYDLGVSYVSHDADEVVLRVDESLTFVDLTPDAAIALRY